MRKTFFLLAALCCAVTSAFATNYDVWITGYQNKVTQVTSDNKDDILGKGNQQLSFDPITNTLTYRQVSSQSRLYAIRTNIADFTIKTQLAEDPNEAGPLPTINEGDNDYAIIFPDKLTITGNATFFLAAKTAVFSKTTNIHLDNMEERDGKPLSGNELIFQAKTAFYNVWVNGTALSNIQPSVSGAKYDDSKKELTLTSASIQSIRTTEPVLNIVSAKGDWAGAPKASYITNSGSYGIEIASDTKLTISGDCALYISANVSAINKVTSVTLNGLKEKNDKPLNSREINLEPFYNISINGQQLTTTSDYVNHEGTMINYVPAEKVLYLTDCKNNELYSISIDDPEISVVINGENRICSSTDYAVEINNPLSISGSGTLFVEAKKQAFTADVVLGDGLQKVLDTPTKVFISLPIEKKPTLAKGAFSIDKDTQVKFYEQALCYSPMIDTYAFETEELPQSHWTQYLPWNEDYQKVNILNKPDDYALLSQAQWEYLFRQRPDALYLWAAATVDDVHGYILLPDKWVLPEGLKFTATMMQTEPGFSINTYSVDEWLKMEAAGAFFLPALGYEVNGGLAFKGAAVAYWTSTIDGNKHVALDGSSVKVDYQSSDAAFDYPVRLVHIVEPSEGFVNASASVNANKRIVNGQFVIVREGKTFNMVGAELK